MHIKLPIISFFQHSSFFIAWFLKNSRNKFLNQEFHGQLPEQAWSNGLFDFSKSCPLRYHIFIQTISRWKEMFIRIFNNDHQFFQDSYCSKIWKHFHPYFFIFFCIEIYFLFRSINKIHDDKRRLKQVYLFHVNANIKAKFNNFQEVYSQMKAFITKTAPSWSLS